MSSLRFPVIEAKKTLLQEQDYNFVNKDKKKKSTSNPLELVEELKRKIQQQKKEIDNRNITIQGLQRNFESLSVIVKNEKAQSAALRTELENLKLTSETGDKRASQFHQRCISLEKENKSVKQELKLVKRQLQQSSQHAHTAEDLKKKIVQLQQINQKLHNRYLQVDADKRLLQSQISKYKSIEKEKRMLNEQIVDMESEVKRLTDLNNSLNYKQVVSEQTVARYKNEIATKELRMEELKGRLRDSEKQKERVEFDNDSIKKQVYRLQQKLKQTQSMMENKDLFNKIKSEEEQKMKKEYKSLLAQFNQLEQRYRKVVSESEQKSGMIDFAHNEIEQIRNEQYQLKETSKKKENQYQSEVEKLMKALKQLHQQLDLSTGQSSILNKQLEEEQKKAQNYSQKVGSLHEDVQEMNRKMQEHQERYGQYLKMIAKNEPDVVITNQRELAKLENKSASILSKLQGDIVHLEKQVLELESNSKVQNSNVQTMRKYIKSLEEEVSSKSQELLQKTKLLRRFEQQQQELNRMIAIQRNLSERLKKESEMKVIERMRQLQNEKLKSQKEIEQERRRLEEQVREEKERNEQRLRKEKEKSQKYSKLLQQYKWEEQKLKQMMSRQQQQLSKLSQQKEDEIKRLIGQKEDQLQRQKKNNKLLWSDNKKLKDLENKLKQQSKSLLEEKELAKREEIQRLKRELERKYKEQLGSMKGEESNSGQLKKILAQRTAQFKQQTENYSKLKTESQFYKNRNKELESLVSRLEKQFKDKTADLERENKSSKQVIEVLDKKLKEAETDLLESEKKQKKQLRYLYEQIEEMKNKAKSQRVQQKLALVSKSMGDLDTSLKTLTNTLSCNYCVEVVQSCVRLECGHIYCKKCKGGYEPNCGECKKKGNPTSDKMIDESVSKAQYMRILINTIKDDLSKISQ